MKTRFELGAGVAIVLIVLGAFPSHASQYWNQAKATIHAACASDERSLCPGLDGKGLQTCMRIRAADVSDKCFSTIKSALENKPLHSPPAPIARSSIQIARVKRSKVTRRSIASDFQPVYSQPAPHPPARARARDTRMWMELSEPQGAGAAR